MILVNMCSSGIAEGGIQRCARDIAKMPHGKKFGKYAPVGETGTPIRQIFRDFSGNSRVFGDKFREFFCFNLDQLVLAYFNRIKP